MDRFGVRNGAAPFFYLWIDLNLEMRREGNFLWTDWGSEMGPEQEN